MTSPASSRPPVPRAAAAQRRPAPAPRRPVAERPATPAPRRAGSVALPPAPRPAPSARVGPAHPHLPSVGDRRGLTALGAVVVALVLGLVGGAWDVLTGPGLGTVFGAFFVVGCGLAAAGVRRHDLRAAVVMPPLVYVALALLAGLVERAGDPGSFLVRQALDLTTAVVLGAPVLLLATGTAAAVAGWRTVARRP